LRQQITANTEQHVTLASEKGSLGVE